jgi:UDP-N-acetylglucosamine 2-epimerase (non-hydrolysing)
MTPGIDSKVCVTAQHREMLDQVLEAFEIEPDVDLNLMRAGQGLFDLTARVITGMEAVLKELHPDLVLVHGDTTTSFAVSLSAYYAQTRLGHVEAGLRTWNKHAPFPEEMNRTLTSRLADFHFAPTATSKANLMAEAIPEGAIHVAGNTAIDALLWMRDRVRDRQDLLESTLGPLPDGQPLVLITAHRRESFGPGFESICLALRDLCERFPGTQFVYPVHLNPNVQDPVRRHLTGIPNMNLIEPQPYPPFVALMERSTLILTDSGGIQEEAPSLGKPVLVLREVTERPEAVEAGTVLLVGTNRELLVEQASRLLTDREAYESMSRKINPYGDGLAAPRIVDAILRGFGRDTVYRQGDFGV